MKKFIIIISLIIATCSFLQPAQASKDTVNMINGTVIVGKIARITGELININTKEGFRKLSRVQVLNNRDFIEVGLVKPKIIAGKVFYTDLWKVELKTPEGIIKVPRWRIKKIVLGHVNQPEEQLKIQLPEQYEESEKNLE